MGQRPAAPCGAEWGVAVAAASLLLLAAPPPSLSSTSPPLAILQDPPVAQPGLTVSLTPHPAPASFTACSWFRANGTDVAHEIGTLFGGGAEATPGPAHSGREEIGADCGLRIRALLAADSGVYTVLVRDPQISTASAALLVYEPLPMPEVTPEELLVAEGDNATLQCHPPGGSTALWWQRDGAALSPGGRLSLSADNRTLTLTAVRRGDAGLYGCHVANPVSANRSRDLNLTVAFGPDDVTVTPPGPHHVPVGATLTLLCSATAVPPPTFTWLGAAGRHDGPSWALGPLPASLGGDVVCQALNPYSNHSQNSSAVTVWVWELLSAPSVTPPAVTLPESRNATLQCHPPGGSTALWWQRDGAALSPGGRLSLSADNRTLTLTAARRGDAGLYGCHVANPVSANRSRDVNLTVLYGPDSASISPSGPLWLPLGAELTLHCSAPSVPPSDVTWGRGNVTLGAGPELHLVLSDSAHFGTIRCQATNPELQLSANAHVELRLGAGLSGGAVAGIVLGVLLGLGLIAAGGVLVWRQLHRPPPAPKTPMGPAATADTNGDSAATADPQYSTIVFPPGGGAAPRPAPPPPSSVYAEVKTR